MLAQFQERYPNASLLSELLTIYQGKFVVQVSVQIEGVVRATGMAAAETVELAEDQARTRAISLVATQVEIPPAQTSSVEAFSNPQREVLTPKPAAPTESYPEFNPKITTDYFPPTDFDSESVVEEDFGIAPITTTNSYPDSFSNVTPFVPRTFTEAPLLDPVEVIEPIDLSDTLVAIETELRNLRWTAEQERKYIKRIYSKESRDLLSPEQLDEFLKYLQVFAQTGKELERLEWTNQQGKEYLLENYNKQSRQYLTYQELKEFLQHLQATTKKKPLDRRSRGFF